MLSLQHINFKSQQVFDKSLGYIEAGLPDITHTHSTSYRYKDPGLSGGGNNGVGSGSGWFGYANESAISGNNSTISSIYGKSNTVTPLTLTVRYLIKYQYFIKYLTVIVKGVTVDDLL